MRYWKLIVISFAFLLAGCTTTAVNTGAFKRLSVRGNWGIVPFFNHTSVPLAANRIKSITTGLLTVRGIRNLFIYPTTNNCSQLVPCANPLPNPKKLRAWIDNNNINYLVAGSVNEWRYKVGLDGEPSVSVVLQVIDSHTGLVLWTSVGSKTGGSRSGLSTITQQLLTNMVEHIPLYVYRL